MNVVDVRRLKLVLLKMLIVLIVVQDLDWLFVDELITKQSFDKFPNQKIEMGISMVNVPSKKFPFLSVEKQSLFFSRSNNARITIMPRR